MMRDKGCGKVGESGSRGVGESGSRGAESGIRDTGYGIRDPMYGDPRIGGSGDTSGNKDYREPENLG